MGLGGCIAPTALSPARGLTYHLPGTHGTRRDIRTRLAHYLELQPAASWLTKWTRANMIGNDGVVGGPFVAISTRLLPGLVSHRDMVTAVLFPSTSVELPKPFQAQDWFRAVLSSSPSPKRKCVSPTHAGKQSHRSQKSHEYHDAGVKPLPNCRPIRRSTATRADQPEHQASSAGIRMIRTCSVPSPRCRCLHIACIGSAFTAPGSCALALTSIPSPQRELRERRLRAGIFRQPKLQR